jgi:hypothetical protein
MWIVVQGGNVMTCYVYFWDYVGSTSAFGHASMAVDGGDPGGQYYISWWPDCLPNGTSADWDSQKQEYFGMCEPFRSRKLSTDIESESGRPDHRVLLLGLDETAIKSFWTDLMSDPRAQWSATTTNCAAAVAAALNAGGSGNYFNVVEQLAFDIWWNNSFCWTPKSVHHYALKLQGKLRDADLMP